MIQNDEILNHFGVSGGWHQIMPDKLFKAL